MNISDNTAIIHKKKWKKTHSANDEKMSMAQKDVNTKIKTCTAFPTAKKRAKSQKVYNEHSL